MKVVYLLYPWFTALDVVGTFQVLAAAPGTRSVFVAARAGAVVDDTGWCALQASANLGDVAAADVLVVPGSDCSCEPDPTLVEWLRVVHPTTTWTLSVGTGSSYLAAAGALDGATAATHWASAQRLTDVGVTYSDERVVRAGKVFTSAGASAGIDLALTLLGISHGPAVAQAVQLTLEYDPQPLSSDQPRPSDAPAPVGRRRRVEVVAGIGFVAVWAVSGSLLGLEGVGVALLGVLLLAAFQTLVRRRPLRSHHRRGDDDQHCGDQQLSRPAIGDFWHISTWQTGQTVTHHAGQTSGYASYLGLDRPRHKAVIVLSDVANDASDLGSQLLADRK